MDEKHLSPELLEEALRSETPSRELVRQLLEHVVADCARCRAAYETVQSRRRHGRQPVGDELAARLSGYAIDIQELEKEAAQDREDLLGLPEEERRERVQRATKRFRNPLLVDLLLRDSRRRATEDPREARHFAELAHDVALRLPHALFGKSWAMTAVARANAYRGNALRIDGGLREAGDLLQFALAIFDRDGNRQPQVRGEILSLLASLRRAQRQFDASAHLLDEAVALFRSAGQPWAVARTLIKKGDLSREVGEPEQAIAELAAATAALDPQRDRKLFLCAVHNRALCLCDLGRYEEAQEEVGANLPLYREFPDRRNRLRLEWLLSKVALGRGELLSATAGLEQVRRGFLDDGAPYDAALAGLELALVYVEQGEGRRLEELAEEMLAVFRSLEVERETMATLLLFQKAAASEAVTAHMVEELVERLRHRGAGACRGG